MVYYHPDERHNNQEQWKKRIEDWKSSGLSGAAWCRKEGATYCQFLYWKKRLFDDSIQKMDSQSFIEIEDAADTSGVEVMVGEFSIRVSKDFDSATLCKCVHALRGAAC
jgi:hypothetical protein